MNDLKFSQLREANAERLPLFKNSRGAPAHTKPDGSDWSPAQWLEAVLGELGELNEVRLQFECRMIGYVEYKTKCANETADVLTYLDLFAQRAYDIVPETTTPSRAQLLMVVVAALGNYANWSKKFTRGDIDLETFNEFKRRDLRSAHQALLDLMDFVPVAGQHRSDAVRVSFDGFDLGEAVQEKFNEVSSRVGCNVCLQGGDA